MPSLNLDFDYFDHPKTKRLIGLLGRGAEVLPVRLWCYCGRYHKRDGSLTDYSPREIETLAGWWGAPGKAIAALVKVGFVDATATGHRIHDWQEHAGHLEHFHQAAKTAAAARWSKRATTPPPDPPPPPPPECAPQSGPQCVPHAERNAPAVHGSTLHGSTEGEGESPPADAGAPSPPKRSNPKTGAVGAYCDAWRERYGLEPVITAKDAKAVNAAMVAIPESEREAIARAYVADDSPRLVERKHPLSWLVTDINRLRVQVAKAKPSKPRRVIDDNAPAWVREVNRLLGNRERPPLSDEQDERWSRMTRAWGSWLAGEDPQPSAEEIAVLVEISKLERKIA